MGSPGGTINANRQNQDVSSGQYLGTKLKDIRGMNPAFYLTKTFYVLSGYYAAGGVKERWLGTSVSTPPPSGHTLQDTEVEGSWTTLT
jgi:hypothetical protein